MSLSDLLRVLKEDGCYPCISYRGGDIWRAHVNGAGNYWAEGKSPRRALRKAIKIWEKACRPMDGYASGKDVGIN